MPATKGGGIVEKQVMKLPVKPTLQRLTNVAAYARVSSGKDASITPTGVLLDEVAVVAYLCCQ